MSNTLPGGFGTFSSTPNASAFGSSGNSGGSLFGNAANQSNTNNSANTAPTPGTPGIFGAGNLFGVKPAGAFATANTPTGPSSTPATPVPGATLFGQPVSNAQQTSTSNPGTPAPSFGVSGGLFGQKPAEQNAGVAPKPGGLFGVPTATSNTTTTPSLPNFFAKSAETNPTSNQGASAPAAPSGGLAFGGGNLFGKKPEAATGTSTSPAPTTTNTTAPAAPASGGSLFSAFGQKKDDAADKNQSAGSSVTPTPAPAAGSLFGQPAANKETGSGTSTPAAPSTGFGLFGQKPAEKKDTSAEEKKDGISNTATLNSTPTAASISVQPPSMLRGKTIEEIVNKWSSDLETHVKEFSRLAGEIAVWDRALIDNGNTLAALFQHVAIAEREQSDVEQNLKLMEEQQKELSSTLEVYEKAAGEIFDGQGGGLRALDVGPADAERDKHYTLAADLNANLDDLSRSLLQMIESVNTLSTDSADAEGRSRNGAPLEQIAQILSSHLEGLQWIDGAVREVDSKVTEVERAMRDASGATSRTGTSSPSLNGSLNTSTSFSRARGFGLR